MGPLLEAKIVVIGSKVHKFDLSIKGDSNILKGKVAMSHPHVVKKGINPEKLLHILIHQLTVRPKRVPLRKESLREVLKGLIVVGRTVNRLISDSRAPPQSRVVLLKFQEKSQGRGKGQLGYPEHQDTTFIVSVATPHLSVQILTVQLRLTVTDHIVLYLFLVVGADLRLHLVTNIHFRPHLLLPMTVNWDDLEPLFEKKDNYDPEQEQVQQYAEFLGLELPQDRKYLPIVKEGLVAPLPPFWEACETKNGELLFRNRRTRQITEENPLDGVYRKKIQEIKRIEGLYGVHQPINEESMLRESSGILLRTSRGLKQSGVRVSLLKSELEAHSSLIERHITEESQYSESPSAGSIEKKTLPEWKRKHTARVETLRANLLSYFPSRQELTAENRQSREQGEKEKARDKLSEEVARKRTELERMQAERRQLEDFWLLRLSEA